MSRVKSQDSQVQQTQHLPAAPPAQEPAQIDLPIRVRNEADHPGEPKTQGWEQYFGTDDKNFAKWQQLGRDLGLPEETLTSKKTIRKALRGTWVNIHDFVYHAKNKPDDALRGTWVNIHDFVYHAKNKPDDVQFFESERQLSEYTLRTKKIFPRSHISHDSPLCDLLAQILNPRQGSKSKK
ncbi:hypothetical protein VM1G_02648 [Cytospora mali]|uniref:Uncharacterized protein n=1 Tax=Cytospora mali TaxID=578113 RepID=A0A194VVK4_CYTMA|nr:hypothetical protein VM1G_02648 [Valsa mali]